MTHNTSNTVVLDALDASLASRVLSATADVALVIDNGGFVRNVTFGGDRTLQTELEDLVGRLWVETVTPETREKANALIAEATNSSLSRPRELNHQKASTGESVPVRYSALQADQNGQTIVVGRDLRTVAALEQRLFVAQQAMEREYARLRSAETRYRVLFNLTSEAVIISESGNKRIVEANPAALSILGETNKVAGKTLFQLFRTEDQAALHAMVAQATSAGESAATNLRAMASGETNRVRLSLFRQDGMSFLLMRIDRPSDGTAVAPAKDKALLELINSLPDAFVMSTQDGTVVAANNAFLELVHLGTAKQVEGQPLDRWLGRGSIDVATLRGVLAEHGSARSFATIVRGNFGSVEEVDVSAVAVDSDLGYHGFLIRSRPREIALESRLTADMPKSVLQMTELVGSVPLKDLVRQTTDIIERLCIEAALQITGDNRASAADMLGLSRQSLYAKLNRYGIDGPLPN